MPSPHIINRSSLSKALKKPYPDMVQSYYYYGLGEPTLQMMRFYENSRQRLLSGITNYGTPVWIKKLREYECLIELIKTILAHPEHKDRGSVRDIYTQLAEVV